ncbi:hypothetical protein PInf_008953 [Phytophthora infestans]|nr:hypothetical protein PInf_008953 [Phytophthora infestans]
MYGEQRRQGDEDVSAYEADVVHGVSACVIDTGPNFMDEGADECSGLSSDEDPELREEPEDEEDADDDSWDGDWDIGELTDEDSDHELEELPSTVWLSAAKNAPLITAMRTDGWEYDSTYAMTTSLVAHLFVRNVQTQLNLYNDTLLHLLK